MTTTATSTVTTAPYKFTGKERDIESGNDYFGARYYASSMGRWLSPDPKQPNIKHLFNPRKWNKYNYVLGRRGRASGTDGMFPELKIDHLHLNRPFDQLYPRTTPAIFHPDFAPNASLPALAKLLRHNSAPAARNPPRQPSIFYSFLFNNF